MGKNETPEPAPATLALTQEQFQQLLATLTQPQNAGLSAEALRDILTETSKISAETMKRAMKPENTQHPGKSVFSYPEGDEAKSREGILRHDVYWFGSDLRRDWHQQHWLELELAAKLQPGEYVVSGTNNSGHLRITAVGTFDGNRALSKLDVYSEDLRGHRALNIYPPMAVWMYQMVHKDRPADDTYWEGMTLFHNHIVKLKAPAPETVGA